MSTRRGRGVELTRAELERMGGAGTSLLELGAAPPVSVDAAALRRVKKEARDRQWAADVALLTMRLKVRGVSAPVQELPFAQHVGRGWRFDLAWPEHQLALEADGGAYTGGRHTRGAGFEEDQVKRNTAILLGWRVLHVLTKNVANATTVSLITAAIEAHKSPITPPYTEEYARCGKPRKDSARSARPRRAR